MSTTGRKGEPGAEGAGGHALSGGGPSQLGIDGSMRARDVSRPTKEDVANAETNVRINRRSAAATPPSARNP